MRAVARRFIITMAEFISGLQLSKRLYLEIVRPIFDDYFPNVSYGAALIGWGSEVLGYDDPISTDHNWGPRLQLFLSPFTYGDIGASILERLDEHMPPFLHGYPTRFVVSVPAHQRGLEEMGLLSEKHNVVLTTVSTFFQTYLGCEPEATLRPVDWLLLPEHRLLTVTSGRVFHDRTGELGRARERFATYPDDVWRYLMAIQWSKLAEQEAFVGRTGHSGDELGSRLLAARQVQLMLHLCFLIERRYAPYSKWLGRAFSELRCAPRLAPTFERILNAARWREREQFLAIAYESLARMHNQLQLTPPLREETRSYYERPYRVLFAGRFADALFETVQDRALRTLPYHVGSINQFVDLALKEAPPFAEHLRGLYKY